MKSMKIKKRILYIDFAKAIAIILVVIGHYSPDYHPVWYGQLRSIIYGFHMPLFMFASGFVYIATFRHEPYGIFLLRKLKRLMIPYFVVSVIIITIKMLTQGAAYVQNPVTSISYVKVFYLPEAGYFTWFIWALWWMFVLVPLFNDKRKRLLLLICAIILYFLPITFPQEFCLREFKGMLLYFSLGCVVWDYKGLFVWCKIIPVSVYIVLFVAVNALKYIGIPIGPDGVTIILSLVGIAFLVRFCKWIEEKQHAYTNKVLITIASSSYVIYLLHTTFEGFAKAIVHKGSTLMDTNNDLVFSLEAIFVIVCGIIIPILLDIYVIRKNYVTKFLFKYKLIKLRSNIN